MDDYFVEPIIVSTDDMKAPEPGNTLYESRKNYFDTVIYKEGAPEVTITIMGYNRLEKTKRCIEYVLKYTTDVNYELILVDNGSSDGTYEYFQTVPYKYKKIIRVTKNIGVGGVSETLRQVGGGKFVVSLGNDICVTKNWLSNLLKCIKSDEKIAYVVPMMSNSSNMQDPGLEFSNYKEMQEIAEKFNISDPSKWQERMRIVNPMSVFRIGLGRLAGVGDPGFYHDFVEDDLSLRIRRLGYKLMVCGDTFVHHDHDVFNMEDKDPEEFKKSLEIGRQNFREKYHGLDAWDDINNFEEKLINMLSKEGLSDIPNILGIDVRCGTPILEVKNKLRLDGVNKTNPFGFTTDAKYYEDLLSICNEAYCNKIDDIQDYFKPETFDVIILGNAINYYTKSIRTLEKIIELGKPGSKILFKFKNTADVRTMLISLGNINNTEGDMPIHISLDDMLNCVSLMKIKEVRISNELHTADTAFRQKMSEIINNSGISKNSEETLTRLFTKEYLFCITK